MALLDWKRKLLITDSLGSCFPEQKCRDTYIDNVVVQVVQRCLLRGFDDLFRHDWMYNNALFDKITKDPNKDANAEKERTLREHISILTSAEADLEKLLGKYNRD